jgi:hypothetical protein
MPVEDTLSQGNCGVGQEDSAEIFDVLGMMEVSVRALALKAGSLWRETRG